MNVLAVLRLLGRLLILLGLAQLAPLFVALLYGESTSAGAFLISAIIAAGLGAGLLTLLPDRNPTLFQREGILIVALGWLSASILGGLPYLLTGTLVAPVDALFEAASGFTTTGATVLPDIEAADRSILFWRSFTQWLGGLGIVVVFLALLSGFGLNARVLYRIEVPGPSAEVLHPKVTETAKALFKLYLLLTVIQAVSLMLVGLSFYDAVTHSLATLSTGGFSPYASSAAAFGPAAQWITIAFMVLAGTNFSLMFAVARGRARPWQDREFATYIGMLLTTTIAVTLFLAVRSDASLGTAIRNAAFQVTSLMTSTGFASVDYDLWAPGAKVLLLSVMMVGGCAGSTAGGIKVVRVYLGFKSALREVTLVFKPNAIIPISMRGKAIPDDVVRGTTAFLLLFGALLVAGTIGLALGGHDLTTSLTAALAALGNIGPGLGGVGPEESFRLFNTAEKLGLVALMWLGRLEILAIAALFTPAFWRR